MNLYFLVEGRRSEAKVYPLWLSHLLPHLTRVQRFDEAKENHYFLISGGGYPSIFHHLQNAVEEVNSVKSYDYLVLCLDADEYSVEERKKEVAGFLEKKKLELDRVELKVIVQNRCLEKWFLGNRVVYPRQPESEVFREYAGFYDVSLDDPELMGLFKGFSSISAFHYSYLREMLAERNIKYTKSMPRAVTEKHYLGQLLSRVKDTGHLGTMKEFFDFCDFLGSKRSHVL